MRTFSKFTQLFQIDEPESGSRKPESVGYGVLSSGEKNYSVRQMYMNFFQPRKSAPEAALYGLQGRSLRPKKQADEPTFLSDVYNRCTRAKKWQTDGCLSGRSMVEMIGVLAIIGVLSVGAISGYSAAMNKYRMNKTIDLITNIFQNALEFSGKKVELISERKDYIKYGIISEADCPLDFKSAVISYDTTLCPLPIKGAELQIYLATHEDKGGYFDQAPPSGIRAWIEIKFYGSPSRSKDNCINFLSYHWEKILPPEWWGPYGGIQVYNQGSNGEASTYIYLYSSGNLYDQEPTLEDISKACSICHETFGPDCEIQISS